MPQVELSRSSILDRSFRGLRRIDISLSEVCQTLVVMEPLDERQIRALRNASGITTFKIFLDMNDFMLDLATKGGRKDEMEKLARVVYGKNQKIIGSPKKTAFPK